MEPSQTTHDGLKRADAIAAKLRDDILRGVYPAGERLPAERDLAAQYQANRASIREALKKLEQLGLLSIRRGGGATVRKVHEASVDIIRHLLHVDGDLDASLALQILDVNEIMVAGAARLAVERASDNELLEARTLLRRLAEADAERDMSARLAIVDDLFELITRASDNLVLRMIHNAIRPTLTGELGALLWRVLHPTREVLREQIGAIDAAIAARDPQAAEEAIRSMLRDRRTRLWKILNESDGSLQLRLDGDAGPLE